jgi:hypothetical protein
MKGLEPSTFCMASVLREHRAIQGRMETTLAAGAVPVSSPFFPLARYHCVTNDEQV